MTVYLELTVESFNRPLFERGKHRVGAGSSSVRRPLRGIEVKDDTHAVIRVIDALGKEVPLISSSYPGGKGPDYTNFILQSVQDPREEKSQIIETFGESYLFLFGEKHRLVSVSAILVNSFDFNWKAEFIANYEQYLRGTKCAEIGARVYLYYDDNIVEGYMLKTSIAEDVNNPHIVPLQFMMFVTRSTNISFVEDSTYPIRPSAVGAEALAETTTVSGLGTRNEQLPFWLSQDTSDTGETAGGTQTGTASDSYFDIFRRTKEVRGDITDNIDEWTGDLFAWPLDQGKVLQAAMLDALKLQEEFIRRACAAGAAADSPGVLNKFGINNPGDAWAAIKDGWNAAKSGEWTKPESWAQAASHLIDGSAVAQVNTPWGRGTATAGMGQGGYYAGAAWQRGPDGAGGGYYAGASVGYDPESGEFPVAAGGARYYTGVGELLPGETFSPGIGSGSSPSYLEGSGVAGAWAGYSAGGGVSTGYGVSSRGGGSVSAYSEVTGYAGVTGGFQGGAGYAGAGYAAGYSSGSPTNAAAMYYASAGGSWDPDNGFQWGSASGSTPVPGEPGGGMFTLESLAPTSQAEADSLPYGQMDPVQCPGRATELGIADL